MKFRSSRNNCEQFEMAHVLPLYRYQGKRVRKEFKLKRGDNAMFQFRPTTTVKKKQQGTDGVDRNRFAATIFRAHLRSNEAGSDNLFVIAQTFINRERTRIPVAEGVLGIL